MNEQLALPFDIKELATLAYVWPCSSCGSVTWVTRSVFAGLKEGTLPGILCGPCMPTPTNRNSMAA